MVSKQMELAKALAYYAHDGQMYGKFNYVDQHVVDVVNRVDQYTKLATYEFREQCLIVAWLHDVAEDSQITINTIEDLFGYVIADSVWAISKTCLIIDGSGTGIPYRTSKPKYKDYIKRVKEDDIARIVKICDTMSNLEFSKTNKDYKRIEKYTNQLKLLMEPECTTT